MGNLFGSEETTTKTKDSSSMRVTFVGSKSSGKSSLILTLSGSSKAGSIPFDADYHAFKDCVKSVEEGEMKTSKGDSITLADSRDEDDYQKLVDASMSSSRAVVILVSSKKAGFSNLEPDESYKRALEYMKRVPGKIPIIIVYSRADLLGKDDVDPSMKKTDDDRIVRTIKLSSKTRSGIADIKEAIEKVVYG